MINEPWDADCTPDDDDDADDFEYTIDFQPDEGLEAALNDEAICPRGHAAIVRESDGAIWCDHPGCESGTLYWSDWTGVIQGLKNLPEHRDHEAA